MLFSDFPQQVRSDVLRRGQDVHALGKILDFSEFKQGIWTADVQGSTARYRTEFHLEGENVSKWKCSCPYSESPVCKHIVGLYTAIVLERQYREFRKRTGLPQRLRARPSFHELVQARAGDLSKDALIDLIAEMGKWNFEARQDFEEAIAREDEPSPGQ